MANKEILLMQEGMVWGEIQDFAQNAVVQIFAQVGKFNWTEPYKIEDQYEGRGSGFLINEEGFLITNTHVVNEAKLVWVHIPALGREPLYTDVVSICPDVDIALLRLQEGSMQKIRALLGAIPYLTLGDSDQLYRAESVLTLGYPLGQYRLKSSTGVVSGRELLDGHALIQITAPINPGNSGGPLLNLRGQVIAIAIASVPLASNIGYAIPINDLKIIIDNLYTQNLIQKPQLGIQLMFASDEKATYLNNPIPAGLYVTNVFKGSLADKIGLQAGDMIYECNGVRLDPYGDAVVEWSSNKVSFFELMSRIKIGEKASLVIYREGKRLPLEFMYDVVQIFNIRSMYPDYESVEYETIAGLVIMELSSNHLPDLIEGAPELIKYQLAQNRLNSVLVISHMLPGSYAHRLRMLRIGDIITEINGKKVKTLHDMRRVIKQSSTTGLLTLKTELSAFVVFSLAKILEGESRLCKGFAYPLSKMVQTLYRTVEKNAEYKKKSE